MSASPSSRPTDPGGGTATSGTHGAVGVALGSEDVNGGGIEQDTRAAGSGGEHASEPQTPSSDQAPPAGTQKQGGDPSESKPEDPSTNEGATSKVWSPEGARRLRETLQQPAEGSNAASAASGGATMRAGPGATMDGELAEHYACALKPANLVADGYQRAMTDMEVNTAYLWATGKLHLAGVPRFFMETFTSDEYDELADYHKRHLMYRLYVRLPRGFTLPMYNANRQFWNLLHKGAEATCGTKAKDLVNRLFADHYTTTCEVKCQLVTLTFTSPAVRNSWKNRLLPFITSRLKIQLLASDTLSSPDPAKGYDAGARSLQYSVLLLGFQSKSQQEVRAIARALCGTHPSLVEEIPPVGQLFMPHFWKLTYGQLSCPTELHDVHRIQVRQADEAFTAHVHHHLTAPKFPCGECLSVLHTTKDCRTQHKDPMLEAHTRTVVIGSKPKPCLIAKIKHKHELVASLERLRQVAAPQLAQRTEAVPSRTPRSARARSDRPTVTANRQPAMDEAGRQETVTQRRLQQETAAQRRLHAERARAAVEAMATAKRIQHEAQLQAELAIVRKARQQKGAPPRDNKATRTSEPTHGPATNTEVPTGAQERQTPTGDQQERLTATEGETRRAGDVPMAADRPRPPKIDTDLGRSEATANAAQERTETATNLSQDTLQDDDVEMEDTAGDTEAREDHPAKVSAPETSASTPAPASSDRQCGATKTPTQGTQEETTNKTSTSRRGSRTTPKHPGSRRGSSPLNYIPLSKTFAPVKGQPDDVSTETTGTDAEDIHSDAQATQTEQEGTAGVEASKQDIHPEVGHASNASTANDSTTQFQHGGAEGLASRPPSPEAASAQTKRDVTDTEQPHRSVRQDELQTTPTVETTREEQMPLAAPPLSPRKRDRAAPGPEDAGATDATPLKSPRTPLKRTPAGRSHVADQASAGSDSDDFISRTEMPTLPSLRARRGDGAADRIQVQAAVTEFFAPSRGEMGATVGDHADQERPSEQRSDADTQSSLERDELVADAEEGPDQVSGLEHWLQLFEARIVDNKADGRCLYQAVDGALRQTVTGRTLGSGKFATKEAYVLKQTACTYLLHYIPQMVADGTVHLRDLHARYYGCEDTDLTDHAKYVEIVSHIWGTYSYDADDALPPEHWSGAEELFGLVWYLREPVFVIGADAHVQVYLVEQADAKSAYDETIAILTPDDRRAWAMIHTLINHGAIPRILIHGAGHFRTFRLPEAYYKRCYAQCQRPGADTLRDRLNVALIKLGLYPAFAKPPLPLASPEDALAPPTQLSGSIYTPSADGTDSSQDDDLAALTPEDLDRLLEHLNPHQRLRSEERNFWRVTERANTAAIQDPAMPGYTTADGIPTIDAVLRAMERRLHDPEQAIDTLAALPYPLVAAAKLPDTLTTRLGKELTMLGRAATYETWRDRLSPGTRDRLAEPTGREETTDQKWRRAQDKNRWRDLEAALGAEVQQHRTLPSSEEAQMLKMMVVLVLCMPRTIPFASRCELAHTWISTSAADARQLLVELRCHRWTSLRGIAAAIAVTASTPRTPVRGGGR